MLGVVLPKRACYVVLSTLAKECRSVRLRAADTRVSREHVASLSCTVNKLQPTISMYQACSQVMNRPADRFRVF